MRNLTLLCLLSGLLWGCSPSGDGDQEKKKAQENKVEQKIAPAAPAAPVAPAAPAATASASGVEVASLPVILESYDVGQNVYVRSLMVEKEKNRLWVGTSVGVMEIDLEKGAVVNTFTRKEGLANEYVFAIGLDRNGAKWFGTNSGGASRYQNGEWKTWFPMHGLADYWVYSFAQHPDGGLWIGTWAGVNRLDLDTGRMDTFVKELVNEWVYAMVVDGQKRIWFGTEGGITRLDGQEWRSWTHADGLGAENVDELPLSTNTGLGTRNRHDLGVLSGGMSTYNPNYVFSLALEKDGALWAGTWGGGVSRFDGQNWRSFARKEGLPGNIVYGLTFDRQERLWAGTSNGLGYYQQGKWQALPENHRLLGAHVYALAVSPADELWAGTRGKVYRIGLTNKVKE
ncbi:MAG: regulator [Magnetococcales bacterium]|nr:regulator [Magnetococcales bacterium]